MEFLTLKPEAFGLDISDLSLKIAKLKKKGGSLRLASFGQEEIKPGIIKNGKLEDPAALSKVIKNSLKKVRGEDLKTKYVVACLPEEKAFLEIIKMPLMEEKELKSAVLLEAENYIPLPMEQVYLDFEVIPSLSGPSDKMEVLIAALPKKIIDSYVEAIRGADLFPKALEVESQSIARALVKNGVSPFPVLLIDLGATRTSFTIFSGRSLRFTSSISVSSQGFTKAISNTLKISLAEAENLKLKWGIEGAFGIGEEKETLKVQNQQKKVFEALIPSLTDLTEEIKKYIDYYQSHTKEDNLSRDKREISKIILCGGGARLSGLPEFLSSQLKIPVELGNPWVNILPAPLKEIPVLSFKESLAYTTALGLALRGLEYD